MKVVRLPDTDVALDAINSGLADVGDTLVVEHEQVVGVASPFQFAVTVKRGLLAEFLVDFPTGPKEFVALVSSIRFAVAEAKRLGYEVIPEFAEMCETN